jgi:hypothetical protein
MILGRPTNLWLGFLTSATSLVALLVVTLGHADGDVVATVAAAITLVEGAFIALVAGQPPTVNSGDTVKVVTQTPQGQPNTVTPTTV